ncbi:hypothetical protein BC829DRAFT_413690 [Chytridium lagenaria]|nr:hypothetical protein BC829DRAFT_413690 [Chytridium lagenaria]
MTVVRLLLPLLLTLLATSTLAAPLHPNRRWAVELENDAAEIVVDKREIQEKAFPKLRWGHAAVGHDGGLEERSAEDSFPKDLDWGKDGKFVVSEEEGESL